MLAAATLALSWIGLRSGLRWALPALQALPAWLLMAAALKRSGRAEAILFVVWWAFCVAVTVVAFTILEPGRAEASILNAATYRDEMFQWIVTGSGRESTPSVFIVQHLTHAAIFCLLGLSTAGIVSMAMGAMLMNYMSFYVGDLIAHCAAREGTLSAMFLAWNPWSMIRVVSFIILGVLLAEPLLSRWRGLNTDPSGRNRWFILALAGLVLDLLLKTLLAPLWPGMLRVCLG